MSDSEPKVKVTDKRMFTPDGELREDFRHLEATDTGEEAATKARAPVAEEAAQPPSVEASAGDEAARQAPSSPAGRPPSPAQSRGGLPEQPTFFDLLGSLAEPIALFLGDAKLPDGRSTQDLEAARFHIDLLEVLQQKTVGNLSAEESALLKDLLYRLRLRYVQKTG